MLISEILFFLFILQNSIPSHSYEYCKNEADICGSNPHIVCHPEQIHPNGPLKFIIPNTNIFKHWIIYWHNYYRNEVACGNVDGASGKLPRASQMRELTWDYELAYLSRIHASRCASVHDKCRKTQRIKFAGQNLAHQNEANNSMSHAYRSITDWFDEHKLVNDDILKGHSQADADTGHFTLMVTDKVSRVGCTMTYCKIKKQKETYMTCNYDYNNVKGMRAYRTGKSASKCANWNVEKSSNFSCLCAATSYGFFSS